MGFTSDSDEPFAHRESDHPEMCLFGEFARKYGCAKLGERRPSDTTEGTTWNVVWEPAPLALGITLTTDGAIPAPGELTVVRARLVPRYLSVD